MVRKDEIDREEYFVPSLKSRGTVIYIDIRTPTDEALSELPHVVLTSPQEWGPHIIEFPSGPDYETSLWSIAHHNNVFTTCRCTACI